MQIGMQILDYLNYIYNYSLYVMGFSVEFVQKGCLSLGVSFAFALSPTAKEVGKRTIIISEPGALYNKSSLYSRIAANPSKSALYLLVR